MRTAWAVLVLTVAGRPSLDKATLTDESRPGDSGLHAMRELRTSSESSDYETGISGVLWLLTTDALEACETSCEQGLADAFNRTEDVGCVCPDASDSARRLVDEPPPPSRRELLLPDKKKYVSARRRRLRGLSELEEGVWAAFALRIEGDLVEAAKALEHLSTTGLTKVASAFDVEESELKFSTFTVTPHYSSDEQLTAIAENPDASDVSIVSLDTVDYVGGAKGLGLFLSLVVLWAGTLCLTCSCFYLVYQRLQHKGEDSQKKLPTFNKTPEQTTEPVQRSYNTGPGSAKEAAYLENENSGFSKGDSQAKSASAAAASLPYAEGDAAAGGSSRFSSVSSPLPSRKVVGGVDDNVSDETRLHKPSVAPLSRSQGTRDFSAQDEMTPNSATTPSRLRGIGNFLGNATPAHLRRLAGRMAARSPSLSIASSRRSKQSSSGSSTRSHNRSHSRKSRGSHRRQGTFPGAYSQRNSSEMDHQRPPADPVYTFMIKTIAGKGFKFMSTTEIAFCAMRMYSHFKRTEGNYKRLAVMKNAENVPPVYEIIWLSDANYEQLGQRQTRFFSSGKGTDAEQEKSLLGCLLALSWNDSSSSRSTLQHALSPAMSSRVPTPQDMFWDDFKDSTDALSGDDQMVVLARVILLMAESANKPASLMAPDPPGDTEASENGVEYADIMKALSALHLREIGISLKTSRPGWQEAHVQLVSVLLVIAFLEEGAKNAPPGGERPDPLSSLEWVGILTPEALDGFLVEKLEARRALVELDLEPSGLVIKHDDDGEVERVEPALGEKKEISGGGGSWMGSRGHQRILPRSSERKSRSKRKSHREQSSESLESKKSHSPVVITTINRNKPAAPSVTSDGKDSEIGTGDPGSVAGASSTHSWASTPEDGAGGSGGRGSGGQSSGIRTIKQQRASSYRGGAVVAGTPTSNNTALPNPAFSGERGAGGENKGTGGRSRGFGDIAPPKLTITAVGLPAKGGRRHGGGVVSESAQSKARHDMSPSSQSEVDQMSETSSVVTRVYAPSTCTEDQVAFSRSGPAWMVEESSHGQRSPIESSVFVASPHGVGMSQASVAGSRMGSPPPGVLMDMQRLSERSADTGISQGTAAASRLGTVQRYGSNNGTTTDSRNLVDSLESSNGQSQELTGADMEMPQQSPSNFSAVAESDIAFSEAASRYDPLGYHPSLIRRDESEITPVRRGRLGIDPSSPSSAAGSRFEESPSSNATSLSRIAGGGSPTAAPGGRDMDPATNRSVASSMRSTDSSFFQASSAKSNKSGTRVSSAASASSWDEDDLQNMGARWLSERAYNQQFEEHNHK